MGVLTAGICCRYCLTSRGLKKQDNRLSCLNALTEAKGEAIDKYNLKIINHVELSELLEIIQSLEFTCFSCDGKNTVLSIVEEVKNMEQVERRKVVVTGDLIKVDFSKPNRKIARRS